MPKAEEAPRTEAERSLRHSRLWTLASFGLALLVSAGLYVPLVRNERDEVREHWRDHLMALADDRDQSIQDYLAERSGDARTLADLPRVAEHLEAVRSGLPPDRVDASRIRLETHLSHLRANFGYVAVYCLDAEGRTVASSPGAPTLDPVCVSEVRRTLEGGADRFVDLHRRESGRLTFSHHALVGNPAGGSALGLVVLESDPDRRLFPLLLRQPTPTRTAETLIGAVWHGKLAFLSPLRFGSPTPPSYPVATPEKTLALKAALEGQETFGEFSDYRGEEVLAATRRIDGTPWGLVAKVDRAEAFERLGGWMVRYILFAVLAALSLALLVYGILRRQRLRLLEDLSRQEGLYRALSEQTHDIFILARPDGTIVEANAAAERAYGYGRSELLRMNIVDLRAPSARASLPAARAAALRPEGSLHETLHLSRTGVEFPVEIQAQPVTLGRERLLAGIIRDISERKAQQQRILKLNRLYRTLSEANQALVRAASREDLLKQTCRVLVDYGGFGRACVALQPPVEAGSAVAVAGYPEEPLSGCADQALPDPLPSTPLVLTEGGTHRAFLPLRQYGTLCGVLCVASKEAGTFDSEVMGLLGELALDLSFALEVQETRERKEEAERALRENEERLRLALRAAEQGLYDLNVQTGSCVVSPEYATMLGFDPDTFVETNQAWIDRLHPEDRESVAEAYRAYVAGKVLEYRVEFRQRCADGSWKWILSQGKIVGFDTEGRPLRMLGTHTDITGRKAAEEALRRHEASLRGLYESMSEMLALHEVVCDESGRAVDYRLIECNAAFEKVTGLPRSKACGALASELYGTGEAPFLDAYARVAATGEPIQFEAEFAPMNKHFLISAYSPEKGRFATLALDVTDQVRAQAEQRFLHNAMNASLNEIYVFDAATWKFEFVSRGALQNLGYTLEEMRSKTPVDIKPAFTDASFGEAVAPLLSGELQVLHFETEHERADGTRYPVEVHLQLFDQGKRKVFVAFILDITERERAAEALRESEEKYRSILENMQESYYEVDLAGNLTFFNDSLCALFGYPREELMGMNNRQYTDPENAKRLYRAFNEVYRTGIPTRGFGWEVIRKDGSIRTIEASVSLRKDSNGRPVGFRGLIRDVTEERRAQEALRQSEERFRTLFENSPVGMYRTTPDGRIVEANPKIVSLLGFRSFEELANRNLEEDGFEPSYPREVFKAEMEAAGEVRGLESAWRRRDGQVLRIREHARAVRDDSGRIVCYDGVVEDISAAHRAEEARRLLSTAIEQSHDAVVITDRDGTILYVNPAFERITGYTREEAVGQNPRILKSGVQDEAFYKNLWETILSGHVWTGRLTNRRKDGTHFVEQAVISPVRDEAGAIVTFVAAKRDITQEVELEKRLEHAKSLETIGMVAGGMAHEVRNPLFAISTLTSALDKKFGANEEIRPFIGYIQEHVQRLTDLMNDLLALGRPVARDQFAPCDLCGLAHSVRDLLAKANADGASRLDVDCTTGDAQVLGHPEKISQILLNLVQNALHFSPPDGRVLLKVYRWGDVGVIHVVDRGAGIPADFLPRLFQPFASRRQGGTGLGLAIVRKLVEAHGGTVEGANNTPGPGATFTVRLPLMKE